ncbi:MAG TPA: hypothetical protein VFZ79_11735 [Acidimicrobiales bacterium]
MDGQRAHRVLSIDRVPAIAPQRAATRRAERPSPPVPAPPAQLRIAWAVALGVGWPLVVAVSTALEPAAAEPEAAPGPVVELAALGLFAALLTTVVAAGLRHRAAPVAGVAAGIGFLTFAVLCPVTGHHTFGMWWVAEIGLVTAMLAASMAALGRRARTDA